ncbi:hypothetical protein B0H14DRAFT_2587397 [Mycena olivaceomarginata]|nr:hypothetical protein B0H14DRAFT_2587397 [Mycena olivaceomarginata]
MSRFCWFSDIGTEAWNETHARYTVFARRNPTLVHFCAVSQQEGRLAARAYATAACIWVVAAIREHIQDAAYFAARADVDAALQLMTDDFVNGWGPRSHGRAKRARRRHLARHAKEAIAAAAAGAASADSTMPDTVDDGSWYTSGPGWGGWGSDNLGGWGGGWGGEWGSGSSWGSDS